MPPISAPNAMRMLEIMLVAPTMVPMIDRGKFSRTNDPIATQPMKAPAAAITQRSASPGPTACRYRWRKVRLPRH
jgi:hypothetical protein